MPSTTLPAYLKMVQRQIGKNRLLGAHFRVTEKLDPVTLSSSLQHNNYKVFKH